MSETSQHRGVDSSRVIPLPAKRQRAGTLLLFRRLKIKCGHLVASLSTLTASSEPFDIQTSSSLFLLLLFLGALSLVCLTSTLNLIPILKCLMVFERGKSTKDGFFREFLNLLGFEFLGPRIPVKYFTGRRHLLGESLLQASCLCI